MKKLSFFSLVTVVMLALGWHSAIAQDVVEVTAASPQVTQDFDGMWDGTEATLQMPQGWKVDRNLNAPRTVGTYASASSTVMYTGGTSLASNAKNGTWNFGADDTSDRALGGISTGVADATRCVNLYAHLLNTGKKNIENVNVSYNVEKYRKGSNAAGFAVQLYYSIDGRNWTSAGDKFRTYFAPDSETAGYASVPGETVAVSDVLDVPISRGCDLYLAWNITVASGDAANAAMAIGIDDFSVSGELPTIPASKYYIYVDDQTGWDALGLYAWGDSELFGAWPGEASVGEVSFNKETTYKVFLLDTEGGNYNLIFNNWNNGKQLPDYNITANRDYYFQIDENTVTEVEVVSGVENIVDSKTAINMNGNIVSFPGMIEVYNINGQRVAQGNNTLSIAELSRGIYVVRASNGKQVTSLKVAR